MCHKVCSKNFGKSLNFLVVTTTKP